MEQKLAIVKPKNVSSVYFNKTKYDNIPWHLHPKSVEMYLFK